MKTWLTWMMLFACILIKAQIPNGGFENWMPGPVPAQWNINSHPLTLPPWDPYVIRQDSDQYAGQYAVNLHTNGMFRPKTWVRFPMPSRPDSFALFYKSIFPPCVNDAGYPEADTVFVEVDFLFQGNIIRSIKWQTQTTQINFTRLLLTVPAFAQTIDSCEIRLTGGNVFGGCGIVAAATEFVADDLRFFPTPCFDSSVLCPSCACLTVIDPVCGCDNITYNNSCEARYYHGITSWTNGPCSIQPPSCEAAFGFSKQKDTVTFSDLSQAGVVYRYRWFFGDGDTSAQRNPVHVFATEGNYDVCLIIEALDNQGRNCTDTFCNTVYVTRACIDTSLICDPPHMCCDAPLFDPVCGCDGLTYDNACVALLLNGVTSVTPGPCTTSGITDSENSDLKAWPNPGNGLLNVKTNGRVKGVQMYTLWGAPAAEYRILSRQQNQFVLDFTGKPAGIYWILLQLEDGTTGKLRYVLY